MFTVKDGETNVIQNCVDFATAREVLERTSDSHIEVTLQYDAAVIFLKMLRGYHWFVATERFAPSVSDPSKGFRLHGSVRTTRKEALRTLDNMYGRRFKTECLIKFNVHSASVFV